MKLEWRGTVEEAERAFTTSLEDEVAVVRDRESKTITGTLTIVGSNGNLQGKVELKEGKLHGEEIFYDKDGNIVEENYWIEGSFQRLHHLELRRPRFKILLTMKKNRPTFDPIC